MSWAAVSGSAGAGAEVVVVGAGVVGISIAHALRAHGVSPVVLERSGVNAGQSGVQPGGIRLQWGSAVNCRLALESMAWWKTVEEHLHTTDSLRFTACGYLFLAHSDAVLRRLAENVVVQNAEGIDSRIIAPGEAADLVPGLDAGSLVGAAWCAADGYADQPQAMIEALASGVEIRIAEVQALRPTGAGWVLDTTAGPIAADAVVLAVGVETARLVAPLGVDLPIEREERHLFLSAPIRDRLLEPLVVSAERRLAAKQLQNGRVLASDLGATGPPDEQAPVWRANLRAAIEELLPVLEYVDFSVIASGAYDVTPDRQPIIGPVFHDGLYVAAGLSGHGFMMAPAISRIVAGAVVGVDDPVLHVFDAQRFAEGRLLPEPQVI